MFEEWRAQAIEEGKSEETPVTVPGKPESLAGSDGVRYRATFEDPRDPGDDVAVLELRGLYAHSEVEVTGDRLDGDGTIEHDAYFVPLRVPFVPEGETGNELVVACRAPRDQFGGLYATDMVPEEAAVPGIWWDASLSARQLPYIESTDIRPDVAGETVSLDVETTVVTDEPLETAITYSLKPEGDLKTRGMMQRGSVDIDAGRTTVEHTVEVRDPALWWPRGYGSQNRYHLSAKLDETEHTVTTGIADVGFEEGQLLVNGETVPIRGVNLLTADEADIERALSVNANLVRAHAHVLPESVYEACDREGILVWQDLPLTGPGEFDPDRGSELAGALSRQYASHPSLVAYGVHDDPTDSFPNGLGSGFLDSLRLRWRAWRAEYDRTPAETVADAFPDRRPVFPVIGGPGIDGGAAAYYPGWDYGTPDDIERLLARYPAEVVAAYGAGSLATDDQQDAAGFDAAKHDRHAGGPERSQRYQADLLRTITERLRSDGVGAIASCLRDTDGAGMGIYAHDGTPKTARETLETAYEPIQAFISEPSPGSCPVTVVNDSNESKTATLEWSAGTAGDSLELTLTPQGRLTTDPIDVPAAADDVTLTLATRNHEVTNEYEL